MNGSYSKAAVAHFDSLAKVVPTAQAEAEPADAQRSTPPPESAQAEPELPQCVLDLLAVLNGDGGHYRDEHGLEAACKRAETRFYERLPRGAQAELVPLALRESARRYDYFRRHYSGLMCSQGRGMPSVVFAPNLDQPQFTPELLDATIDAALAASAGDAP